MFYKYPNIAIREEILDVLIRPFDQKLLYAVSTDVQKIVREGMFEYQLSQLGLNLLIAEVAEEIAIDDEITF